MELLALRNCVPSTTSATLVTPASFCGVMHALHGQDRASMVHSSTRHSVDKITIAVRALLGISYALLYASHFRAHVEMACLPHSRRARKTITVALVMPATTCRALRVLRGRARAPTAPSRRSHSADKTTTVVRVPTAISCRALHVLRGRARAPTAPSRRSRNARKTTIAARAAAGIISRALPARHSLAHVPMEA